MGIVDGDAVLALDGLLINETACKIGQSLTFNTAVTHHREPGSSCVDGSPSAIDGCLFEIIIWVVAFIIEVVLLTAVIVPTGLSLMTDCLVKLFTITSKLFF